MSFLNAQMLYWLDWLPCEISRDMRKRKLTQTLIDTKKKKIKQFQVV